MTTGTTTTELNTARVEAFAERLLGTYTGSVVTLMVDLGHRTGLLDALAAGPGTSAELAERAGLVERYVRECLGSLVTAGIVEYSPGTRTYALPAEHAVCLSGPGSSNLAPISRAPRCSPGTSARSSGPSARAAGSGTRRSGPSSPTSWTRSRAACSTASSSTASCP